MDLQPFTELITQAGIWCVAAFLIAKLFIDYIKSDKEQDREDHKQERERDREDYKEEKLRMFSVIDNQGKILDQQKTMLEKQLLMSEHNKDMLDKLTDIQMLHTNRLDRIEDRLGRLEEK